MTTYQFGDITLEQFKPREWRAWRRLEWPRDLPFNASDEWRSGPNKWEPLGPVTNMGNVFDYRRPVPLPSIEEIIFSSAKREDDGCKYFTHPITGKKTQSITRAESWLRALLPGYEEQLAKKDSPVPADGWRPIETLFNGGATVTDFNHDNAAPISEHDQARALHRVVRAMHDGHCPKCGHLEPAEAFQILHDGAMFGHSCPSCRFSISEEEEQRALAIFRPYFLKSVEVFETWRKQPLPPPPQEKGGEA